MAIQHAVLALLADRPSYGYELKGAFETAVGPQWGQLNIGHLYQILDRLGRDGLVVTERHPQPVKPDRRMHAITPAGQAELARWLDEPSPRGGGFRDDFFLKVTAAARSGSAQVLRTVLANQRGYLLRELRNLGALRRDADDPVVGLLLSAASRHVEADLAFLEDAEAALLDGDRVRIPARRAVPAEPLGAPVAAPVEDSPGPGLAQGA
ncbi:helix-turn-helix transcriptional regulator [Plantactinospora soyae]|uniref:DNA-binding PadR family transcriptional regulator n=1 Tax=Plantactinospora soyae TaxID=1544732 RepID=A0A927MDN4_9ACTN|nr:PadR family transcriptional regulator [Plantactinospora soyae]MBE1489833.1 DNA-binding PadR family transcriptional regulator [Plantactinospora soyae]